MMRQKLFQKNIAPRCLKRPQSRGAKNAQRTKTDSKTVPRATKIDPKKAHRAPKSSPKSRPVHRNRPQNRRTTRCASKRAQKWEPCAKIDSKIGAPQTSHQNRTRKRRTLHQNRPQNRRTTQSSPKTAHRAPKAAPKSAHFTATVAMEFLPVPGAVWCWCAAAVKRSRPQRRTMHRKKIHTGPCAQNKVYNRVPYSSIA